MHGHSLITCQNCQGTEINVSLKKLRTVSYVICVSMCLFHMFILYNVSRSTPASVLFHLTRLSVDESSRKPDSCKRTQACWDYSKKHDCLNLLRSFKTGDKTFCNFMLSRP